MAEQQEESVALVRRAESLPATVLSDDEMRRMYRLAESMHLSGAYDDIKKAEQAFVKMMLGRDLGLSPTQAMGGLHLVKGNVQVHYAMLARFINARAEDGYGYRAGWIKQSPPLMEAVEEGGQMVPREVPDSGTREAVYMDEDDPLDMREVVGAFVVFYADEKQVGVSRFTIEDAQAANLIPTDTRAAWHTSRRNMFLARAMSNGVKWFVPEVMGGLPVYVEGEIVPERQSVTAPVGDGDDEGQGIDLGPKVDAVIERAKVLGHAGLANRAALELQLGKRSPSVVNRFVADATKVLDEMEERQKGEAEEDPPEAEVVDENMPSPTGPNHEAPEATAERRQSTPDVVTEDDVAEEQTKLDPRRKTDVLDEAAVTRRRLKSLKDARGEEQDPEQKSLIDEEIDLLEDKLRDLGADPEENATDDDKE